ncbi:DUF4870 domain-containing protein [Opacimonas viscosa]|uniref:DUF4870 domain-containing protein n=1 Tax=Opacimonas viscosa TaxID=2961944 RepID=A0AA42BPG2_9ALTE|nr:DUF4870 domain-containing protein [Opacimonas viscosa]MCP3428396.1 DUF4870 domain-containing protein [Opacimonas viscosa]
MSSSEQTSHFHVETQSKDAQNTAMVMWLASIFLGVFAGLIFSFMQKEQAYIQTQAKEAINWGITLIVGLVVTSVLFGSAIMFALILLNLLFAVMGAIASSTGANFSIPLSLRLWK